MSSSAIDQARDRAAAARVELASTLDALEDKVNLPRKAGELSKKAQDAYEKNPLPFIVGGAAAAIVAVGLVAWAIFSDD